MPKKRVFVVLMMMAALLSACNFPLEFGDPEEVKNAVAETVAAYEVKEEVSVPTLLPTSTPMPTMTPPKVEIEKPVATREPCNSAYFVYETVPDNTKYAPGAGFDKGWTLRNVGYCTWDRDYKLTFDGGDQMNGPAFKEIGKEVKPNEEVEIIVKLAAPSKAGTYRGNWVLQTADGDDIGPMWVKIVVE